MSNINIASLIDQMHIVGDSASATSPIADTSEVMSTEGSSTDSFSSLLKNSIDAVEGAQDKAENLQSSYLKGDDKVDLGQVMVAGNKAELAMDALVEIRNKVTDAYQSVAQMSV